ncbi:synaptobrevin-1-like [Argonauta hians]
MSAQNNNNNTPSNAQSHAQSNDHIVQLNDQVNEVTRLLKANVEKIVERGDKVDNLQTRSEKLDDYSVHFQRSATSVKRSMCWKNARATLVLGFVIFILLAIVIGIIVGVVYDNDKSSSTTPKPHITTTPHSHS